MKFSVFFLNQLAILTDAWGKKGLPMHCAPSARQRFVQIKPSARNQPASFGLRGSSTWHTGAISQCSR